MKKTIYIAGPMTGIEGHNFVAFDAAKARLLAAGYEVVSPADLDRAVGVTENTPVEETLTKMKLMVALDRAALALCDGIYMLRGWERSFGSRAELAQMIQDRGLIMYEESI